MGKGSQAGAMLTSSPTSSAKPVYNLEQRTFLFAQGVRQFAEKFPKNHWYREDIKQVVRSAGSVAANYIEANESVGKRDFKMRIGICLKEAKESRLWLNLLDGKSDRLENDRKKLANEADQLVRIFSAAIRTLRAKNAKKEMTTVA